MRAWILIPMLAGDCLAALCIALLTGEVWRVVVALGIVVSSVLWVQRLWMRP